MILRFFFFKLLSLFSLSLSSLPPFSLPLPSPPFYPPSSPAFPSLLSPLSFPPFLLFALSILLKLCNGESPPSSLGPGVAGFGWSKRCPHGIIRRSQRKSICLSEAVGSAQPGLWILLNPLKNILLVRNYFSFILKK